MTASWQFNTACNASPLATVTLISIKEGGRSLHLPFWRPSRQYLSFFFNAFGRGSGPFSARITCKLMKVLMALPSTGPPDDFHQRSSTVKEKQRKNHVANFLGQPRQTKLTFQGSLFHIAPNGVVGTVLRDRHVRLGNLQFKKSLTPVFHVDAMLKRARKMLLGSLISAKKIFRGVGYTLV